MKIWLRDKVIYEEDDIKYGSKMWIFENEEATVPREGRYVDFTLISDIPTNSELNVYYIDENFDYWKEKNCFFNKKKMEQEKYVRECKKWNMEAL